MSNIKYMREGKGLCVKCTRELDLVVPIVPKGRGGEQTLDMVVSRHLHRIEEFGPKGASPTGFCTGSLTPAMERAPEARTRAKR